jgi:hypothetical protein
MAFKEGVTIGNLWIKTGYKVRVKYFHHEFIGLIVGFGTLGCTIKPETPEPWMTEYTENQFDGIKEGCILVDYICIKEVISNKREFIDAH